MQRDLKFEDFRLKPEKKKERAKEREREKKEVTAVRSLQGRTKHNKTEKQTPKPQMSGNRDEEI